MQNNRETATFAGGCFWCIEHDLNEIPGVIFTTCGFTGGETVDPTYKEVCQGTTGHVEAVLVEFDTNVIKYEELLEKFWHLIDPTRDDGQLHDRGSQYRPLIFYHNEQQKIAAEKSKKRLIESKKVGQILVEILPAQTFYPAEEYHQKYSSKYPVNYSCYVSANDRKNKLKEIWESFDMKDS